MLSGHLVRLRHHQAVGAGEGVENRSEMRSFEFINAIRSAATNICIDIYHHSIGHKLRKYKTVFCFYL